MNENKPFYKAREMEEFADIIFFHPLGFSIAKSAAKLNLTPTQLTFVSMFLGIAGGLLLSSMKTAYIGFCILVMSSVFDSADGQLARMTKQGSLKGRVLDGLVGYFMFTSSYIGLSILYLSLPGNLGLKFILPIAIVGATVSALQSSLYDLYRTSFYSITTNRLENPNDAKNLNGILKFAYCGYFGYQKLLAGSHINLTKKLRSGYLQGENSLGEDYKILNSRIIRGWNLLGDNTRFLLILIAIILCKPHWYFLFILGPLSLVTVFLMVLQKNIDKKFSDKIDRCGK